MFTSGVWQIFLPVATGACYGDEGRRDMQPMISLVTGRDSEENWETLCWISAQRGDSPQYRDAVNSLYLVLSFSLRRPTISLLKFLNEVSHFFTVCTNSKRLISLCNAGQNSFSEGGGWKMHSMFQFHQRFPSRHTKKQKTLIYLNINQLHDKVNKCWVKTNSVRLKGT